jgi:hypothetical protein
VHTFFIPLCNIDRGGGNDVPIQLAAKVESFANYYRIISTWKMHAYGVSNHLITLLVISVRKYIPAIVGTQPSVDELTSLSPPLLLAGLHHHPYRALINTSNRSRAV